MGPLLSIVIPTYNCAGYLDECLRSVLDQLPGDCELVVSDDGSTDDTTKLLASYEAAYDGLKVLYNEHKGASGARNAGLDAASGAYVAFIDCDDMLIPGFLDESHHLLEQDIDLCIFGIERMHIDGNSEFWTVLDAEYPNASAFADEYIRNRHLLVYSGCNKFYRKAIIDELSLRFDETTDFGEDRLFNYAFIQKCGRIVTSSAIMLAYLQRSMDSLSSKRICGYYERAMSLHKAKMACFLNLSQGTTVDQKLDFIAYGFSREIEATMDRFSLHPEERNENLPLINARVFGDADNVDEPVDALIVMGSRNCGYKVRRALEIGAENPDMVFIVSGGNPHLDGVLTEAEFMAAYLKKNGVADKRVYLENRACYSRQNLALSASVVGSLRKAGRQIERIGVLTAGFHMPRTRMLVEDIEGFSGMQVVFFAAYGPNTGRDSWYTNPIGRAIVLEELRKVAKLENRRLFKNA
jgi:hypothetical protein